MRSGVLLVAAALTIAAIVILLRGPQVVEVERVVEHVEYVDVPVEHIKYIEPDLTYRCFVFPVYALVYNTSIEVAELAICGYELTGSDFMVPTHEAVLGVQPDPRNPSRVIEGIIELYPIGDEKEKP